MKKVQSKYSKTIVALCIVTVISYTVACFVYLWNGKPIDTTLTLCFFGCFGIEFASLAAVTRSENKYVKGCGTAKAMPKVETEEQSE